MSMSPVISDQRTISPVFILVGAAILIGALDLIYACTYWNISRGVPPLQIFQTVASGLLGMSSFRDGLVTVSFGALLQYLMLQAMVSTYYVVSRRLPVLIRQPWLYGPLYGLLLYVVMNLIVVPLSAAPKSPFVLSWIIGSIAVHVCLIGPLIAWFSRWASTSHSSAQSQGNHLHPNNWGAES